MTKISLQNAIAQNDKWVSLRSLTAVFVGGTSGIGEYTLRSLAAHYGKSSQSLSLYLVGRNNDAASRIFNDCRKLCPSGRFTFVKASNLSLIRDVDSASDEIKKLVSDASTKKGTAACIDFLVMSHADLYIGGRRETKEGLDKTMSMLYYSRMRFAINLMPLLRASKAAHVISVFGAGLTLFMEKLAVQNAGKVAFVHLFPGVVITPAFGNQDLPGWFRAMWTVAKPVVRYVMAISPEEIGERILYLASPALPPRDAPSATEKGSRKPATSTDGIIGGGAYACKHDAKTIDLISKYKGLKAAKIDEKV
ncbi:hypothetical protein D6C98_10091 [Aureobasidium pullulans]|nr:hypothetical protein D6C98_10091 [Aureobasidium pullulans]